jgi:hypothetical protein
VNFVDWSLIDLTTLLNIKSLYMKKDRFHAVLVVYLIDGNRL